MSKMEKYVRHRLNFGDLLKNPRGVGKGAVRK
jgi:hypothetical protein